MSDTRLKIAVFIDFDNVEIGVKTTLGLHFDVGAVLEAIKEHGEIITKVAYGDWKRAGDHGRAMSNHAVRLVQRVMTPGGDKNGADINLALDALEMAFTHSHINAFVIVGGDSDFITLVEKLKQYDRKVFVVGGRAFTSQVMQKNCTQFIAYENIAPDRRHSQTAAPVRSERGRSHGPSAPLEQAFPLVKRALKVLADREVTPQLGLLKSTLLQLDSSFSERDYGASTFRDFAEKLAERGLVSLKHAGRSTHVELLDTAPIEETASPEATESTPVIQPAAVDAAQPATTPTPTPTQAPASAPAPAQAAAPASGRRGESAPPAAMQDGVAMVRRVLFEAPSPPRWPLYLRQMKQFLRTGQPDFDERKYGSIVDLMRACQKEGIVRLERDRQGGLRVFAGSTAYRAGSTPQPTWGLPDDQEEQALEEAAAARLAAVDAAAGLSAWNEERGNGLNAPGEVGEAEDVADLAAAGAAEAVFPSAEPSAPAPAERGDAAVESEAEPAPAARRPRARRTTRTAPADVDGNTLDAGTAKPKRARKTAAKTARKKAR